MKEVRKQIEQNWGSIRDTARRFGVASLAGVCLVFAAALAFAKEPAAIISVAVLGVAGLAAYAVVKNGRERVDVPSTRHESPRPRHAPPSQLRTPQIASQTPAAREKDKKLATVMLQAFQQRGLPALLKQKNGHTLYFREPADRYRRHADGSLEFIEHGALLITEHEIIFQTPSGASAHALTRLARISHSPNDITIADGAAREIYRLAKPITASVCLICLF